MRYSICWLYCCDLLLLHLPGVHIRLMVTRGLKPTPYQNPNITIGKPTIVIIPEYKVSVQQHNFAYTFAAYKAVLLHLCSSTYLCVQTNGCGLLARIPRTGTAAGGPCDQQLQTECMHPLRAALGLPCTKTTCTDRVPMMTPCYPRTQPHSVKQSMHWRLTARPAGACPRPSGKGDPSVYGARQTGCTRRAGKLLKLTSQLARYDCGWLFIAATCTMLCCWLLGFRVAYPERG